MCRRGMRQLDSEGFGFVHKETKWRTSSPLLAKKLQSVYSNFSGATWHRHGRLLGGNRAALAAVYPPKVVSDVLQTFRRQLENDGLNLKAFAVGPHNAEPEALGGAWRRVGRWSCLCRRRQGRHVRPAARQSRARRRDEVHHETKVFTKVPLETAQKEQGSLHDMKWVDTQKGDKVRSRLVVRDIKAQDFDKLEPSTVLQSRVSRR